MNINFRGQRLIPGYDFLQSQNDNKPIKVSVHEFIQSVVFTPFPQDSELQVERLILAGNIYDSIGFKRKAAFYRRFAALKLVTVQSDWQACYDSLLDSLKGFSLNLEPNVYELSLLDKSSSVWPGLHVQLIEELITCCKKIQTSQAGTLAIRHMSFMLHTLDFYLSPIKIRDTAQELEEATTIYGEDSPVPLKLNNGHTIPTVNLTRYPLCSSLEPRPLPMYLRPARLVSLRRRSSLTPIRNASHDTPFLYTPITNHHSMSVIGSNRGGGSLDVVWVEDEPCTTTIVLSNILPIELNVTSITLMSDGVPLEVKPASVKLKVDPDRKESVNLDGIPRRSREVQDDQGHSSIGRIEILGYTTHVLGVKSNCRIDMLPQSLNIGQIFVDVCPPLPRLKFKLSSESAELDIQEYPTNIDREDTILLARLSLAPDQKLEATLSITNTGPVSLQYLFVKTRQSVKGEKLLSIDDSIIDAVSGSPLGAERSLAVPLIIENRSNDLKLDRVDTVIEFEYSGGLALQEMFCRRCSIKIEVSIVPP